MELRAQDRKSEYMILILMLLLGTDRVSLPKTLHLSDFSFFTYKTRRFYTGESPKSHQFFKSYKFLQIALICIFELSRLLLEKVMNACGRLKMATNSLQLLPVRGGVCYLSS